MWMFMPPLREEPKRGLMTLVKMEPNVNWKPMDMK
jgi:hypothetical protein